MRTGGFTVQQALSAEAASVIKQAVQLARRRGHAQVTPLHVASIMLYSTTGLLRTACLQSQSHSHPLQCKALELCFNVALNRLPASSSTGILGGPQHPSISNALVAAFKRAQAHQRRGSIENQQQPLLAVKIEIQQLMVSILDDPSVSRVMREAGFSSTLVKTKLEENVSLELCSQSPGSSTNDKSSSSKENNSLSVFSSQSSPMLGQERACQQIMVNDQVKNEDVMGVIEMMMSKRTKSLVIVGEEVATVEGVVKGVMDKVNQGDVPDALKEVKFISLPLFSFKNNSRGEVEQKLEDLIRCMKTFVEKGVVLYLGDLKWISDHRASNSGGRNYYCSVEHMIVELGRLAYGLGEGGRFWLMGIGSFQTYTKCKTGHPNSLEGVWGLHPHTIPAANLGLSLTTDSYVQDKDRGSKKAGSRSRSVVIEASEETRLTCCADCSANFKNTSSTLPSWLKDENKRLNGRDDQENVWIKDLCKKWNSFCRSSHKQCQPYEKTVPFSSSTISPSSSASLFYSDPQNPNFNPGSEKPWPAFESNMGIYIPENGRLSNPSSAPNSTSSSDNMEMEYITKFKEFNAENLKTLCSALEKKVPLQNDVIAEIVGTILQCRSGMLRRIEKGRCFNKAPKEETWLFIQGIDKDAKETFARELAKVVFGPSSHSNFISISLSNFYTTRADSIEDSRNKRSRDEQSGTSFFERLTEAMSVNPHRVFLIEDVEQADYCSQMDIKRAIEGGKIRNADGEEVSLGDSIIVLSCESLSSRSRACSPPTKQRIDRTEQEKSVLESEETSPCTSLDLNISFEDDGAADMFIDDIGLVESVDRYIIFN